MKTYSYIGINADQSLQLDAVMSISKKSMGDIELIIEETSARPRLAELVGNLWDGDLVLIYNFNVLAETAIGAVVILSTLAEMGVTVKSVHEGMANPNIAIFLRSVVAEIKRDFDHPDKTFTEQRVRRRGRPAGSRLDIHSTEIQRLLVDGVSHSAIAGQFNISRQSFKDFAISRGLVM